MTCKFHKSNVVMNWKIVNSVVASNMLVHYSNMYTSVLCKADVLKLRTQGSS